MKRFFLVAVALVLVVGAILLVGRSSGPKTTLHIVSGSENKALEPIVRDWGADNGVLVDVSYLGSVDIARALSEGGNSEFDAVWPASSLWIELGDTSKLVKHDTSILRSPVVLGIKKSIATDLGWIGRKDITVEEIQAAARSDVFRLAMTSATQSNSGASAYLGFLYALSGNPDVLTAEHLADPEVQERVRDLLAQIDRSSGSSGWLKDSLVENPVRFDAMFNYEALMIEANQALEEVGQEPLYIIYPTNGLSVADSPLGYINKGDAAKEEAFLKLQEHLLSGDVQDTLLALGRRAGLLGLSADRADPAVWRKEWGVDLERSIAPVPAPASAVIGEALTLYQTELRKPSLTVWVLDVSGSMEGEPLAELKTAMGLLLDPDASAVNLLQPSSRDVTIILPFNHKPGAPLMVSGSKPSDLSEASRYVDRLAADGGTDLYMAVVAALKELRPYAEDGTLFDYLPAIVAMTDGASETVNRPAMLRALQQSGFGLDVPIHSIAFGNADTAQLNELSDATIGRMFTAGDDLAKSLRSAKGYN
ncbi:substrate-binding domain-containing protein [Ruegeria sp. 2205SS24-7]|uniref:vWA domain-containing protein n=1 Tax=Ruegeria discodermiae TaxID=3064389 RepID=UPI002741900B|nr:substrate-binding domain-containing protein [Ruegeria sp. 2205SS24-7]MDP5219027.1 substrate-binding domain-containing protein [Ruegeria sp. 2205SS24-7]